MKKLVSLIITIVFASQNTPYADTAKSALAKSTANCDPGFRRNVHVAAEGGLTPDTISEEGPNFRTVGLITTKYKYGISVLSRVELESFPAVLTLFREQIDTLEGEQRRIAIITAIEYLGNKCGLFSRAIIENIYSRNEDDLKKLLVKLINLLKSGASKDSKDLKDRDIYRFLGEEFSKTGPLDDDAVWIKGFIKKFNWRLVNAYGRLIFATESEAEGFQTSKGTEQQKLQKLLPEGILYFSDQEMIKVSMTAVEEELKALETTEAPTKREELGALIVKPAQTGGIMLKAGRGILGALTPKKKKRRIMSYKPLAEIIVNELKTGGRHSLEKARQLLFNSRSSDDIKAIMILVLKAYPNPLVFEWFQFLPSTLSVEIFLQAFAYRDGKLDVDQAEEIIEKLALIQPHRLWLCDRYSKSDRLAPVEILPISCDMLCRMKSEAEYRPIYERIEQLTQSEKVIFGRLAGENIPGLIEVSTLLKLLRGFKSKDIVKRNSKITVPSAIDEEKLLIKRLKEFLEPKGKRGKPDMLAASNLCFSDGRSPADIVRVLIRYKGNEGVFILMIELLMLQPARNIALFFNELHNEMPISTTKADILDDIILGCYFNVPGASDKQYRLYVRAERIELFSIMIAEIFKRDTEPAEVSRRFNKALEVIDELVRNTDLRKEGSCALAHGILWDEAVEVEEEIAVIRKDISRLSSSEYNSLADFYRTGVLLKADMTKEMRAVAIEKSKEIIADAENVKGIGIIARLNPGGTDGVRVDALSTLGDLAAYEEIQLLLSVAHSRYIVYSDKCRVEALRSLLKTAKKCPDNFSENDLMWLIELYVENEIPPSGRRIMLEIFGEFGGKGNVRFIGALLRQIDISCDYAVSGDRNNKPLSAVAGAIRVSYNPKIPEWAKLIEKLNNRDEIKIDALKLIYTEAGFLEDVLDNIVKVYRGTEGEKLSAIIFLGEKKAVCSVELLIQCAKDRSASRTTIIKSLWRHSFRAYRAVILAEKEQAKTLQQAAIHALGEIGDGRAVPAMYDLLCDDKDTVQLALETMLRCGATKDQMAEGYLKMLGSRRIELCRCAVEELRRHGDGRALDALKKYKAYLDGINKDIESVEGEIEHLSGECQMYSEATDRGDNDFYRVSAEQDARSIGEKEKALRNLRACVAGGILGLVNTAIQEIERRISMPANQILPQSGHGFEMSV